MPDLVLMLLLVSCVSLAFQVAAFARLAARRASTPAAELAGRGYMRTVACRVLAAAMYTTFAVLQLVSVQVGGLSTVSEALIVFTAAQVLWMGNSLMDIRIRRALSQTGKPPYAGRHSP
jgi:hypothetical protein